MQIEITKKVVFKDMHGTVLKTHEVGDIIEANGISHGSSRPDSGYGYFITSMGGIYFEEAREVKP